MLYLLLQWLQTSTHVVLSANISNGSKRKHVSVHRPFITSGGQGRTQVCILSDMLSASRLFWNAAILYLPRRGINRLLLGSFVAAVTSHHWSWCCLKEPRSLFVFFVVCSLAQKLWMVRSIQYGVRLLGAARFVGAAQEQYPVSGVHILDRKKSLVDHWWHKLSLNRCGNL